MTPAPPLARSVLDAIGNTPLVSLGRLALPNDGRILAKLEYLNPGFSKKDRIAREIIENALTTGALSPGQHVVELTSGNTGTGLAIVCAVLGHPLTTVMSVGNSSERARMMSALGANVVLVEQAAGSMPGHVSGADLALVEVRAQELTSSLRAFRVDQFVRDGNRAAHEIHTAAEIWEQAEGRIDAFCDFVGTGGTFAGVAAGLRARNPAIRCYIVEPVGSAVLSGEPSTDPNHAIQGGGYGISPLPLLDGVAVDGFVQVSDEEAINCCRSLARSEGIFAGFSSGAVVAAATKLIEGQVPGGTVAVILADSGLKYLSTELWE
jgi:cysteine synthase A